MHLRACLVFLLVGASCGTKGPVQVRRPATPAALQAPLAPSALPLQSELDYGMLLSVAHILGSNWPEKERSRLERWLVSQIETRLGRNLESAAFQLWRPFAQWLQGVDLAPSREFLVVSRQLLASYQNMGVAAETLQLVNFFDQFEPGAVPNREQLLWGMVELEQVRVALCRHENATNPDGCASLGKLETALYRNIPPGQGFRWLDLLRHVSFSLWGVPADIAFSAIPGWLLEAPRGMRLLASDRWFGICLFNEDCFLNPDPQAQEAMGKLNPYLHQNWKVLSSSRPDARFLEALAQYVHHQLGPAFSGRVCELLEKKLQDRPQVTLCAMKQWSRIEYSLIRRRALVEQLERSPGVKELWEDLFQVTVSRFYHFVEREQLELARQEHAYLEKVVQAMNERWPADAHPGALVVQSLAIVDLLLLRGRIEEARKTCQSMYDKTQDSRVLMSWFRLEFWIGDYTRAVELMEQMKRTMKESVHAQYYYMKNARYHAMALEKLGEENAAQTLRAEAAHFFRNLFEFINDNDMRTETVVDIGKLYFDAGLEDNGLQLFQAALTRNPGCDAVGQILQTLIINEMVDPAFDVYHTLMDHESCRINRKLFASVWMRFFGERFSVEDERMERVRRFLDEFTGDFWLEQLAAFALDRITAEKLLETAGHDGQKAEALYYAGTALLAKKHTAEAFKLFQKVLDLRITIYTEHEFAFWHFENRRRRKK